MPKKQKSKLKEEVADLAKQLQHLNLQPGKNAARNRRRRQKRKARKTGGGFQTAAGQGPLSVIGSGGEITIEHHEIMSTLVAKPDKKEIISTFVLLPGRTGCKILDTLSESFDRYRVDSVSFEWRTFCGMTQSGAVCLAVDFDPTDTNTKTYAEVCSFSPNVRGAVYNNLILPVRSDLLMRQKWLFTRPGSGQITGDQAAIALVVAVKFPAALDQDMGEVWMKYRITMQGARSLN